MSGADVQTALDVRFFLAFLAPTIVFGFWLVRRLMDAERERKALVRALFAEIDFNTKDMEIFLDRTPMSEVMAAVEKNPELIPHITDARHTEIYRSRVGNLHHVTNQTLGKMVQFYGLLEKIRVQIDAIQLPSYGTISTAGRRLAIVRIVHAAEEAEACGLSILAEMQRDYGDLRLERLKRREPPASIEETNSRLRELESVLLQRAVRR